jgi:hypothetical protein
MNKLITILALVALTGCAQMKSWVPSFSDANQSAKIIDVRMSIDQLDCDKPHLAQVRQIKDNLRWFELYSQNAGFRNQDVLNLIKPMQSTVDDFYKRSLQDAQGSKGYCEIKKKLMATQANAAAEVILGRF